MDNKEKPIQRPDVPRGYSFEMYSCSDPECGPHIFLLDEDENPISEMVLDKDGVDYMISSLLDIKHKRGWKDQ